MGSLSKATFSLARGKIVAGNRPDCILRFGNLHWYAGNRKRDHSTELITMPDPHRSRKGTAVGVPKDSAEFSFGRDAISRFKPAGDIQGKELIVSVEPAWIHPMEIFFCPVTCLAMNAYQYNGREMFLLNCRSHFGNHESNSLSVGTVDDGDRATRLNAYWAEKLSLLGVRKGSRFRDGGIVGSVSFLPSRL